MLLWIVGVVFVDVVVVLCRVCVVSCVESKKFPAEEEDVDELKDTGYDVGSIKERKSGIGYAEEFNKATGATAPEALLTWEVASVVLEEDARSLDIIRTSGQKGGEFTREEDTEEEDATTPTGATAPERWWLPSVFLSFSSC